MLLEGRVSVEILLVGGWTSVTIFLVFFAPLREVADGAATALEAAANGSSPVVEAADAALVRLVVRRGRVGTTGRAREVSVLMFSRDEVAETSLGDFDGLPVLAAAVEVDGPLTTTKDAAGAP